MRKTLIALLCIVPLGGCTGLLFYPMRELQLTPAQIDLRYQDVTIVAEDGVRLHGWYLPGDGEIKGNILFLHGNAENISTHIGSVHWLPPAGYNVLLFDYRGYGRSAGIPTLPGAHADAYAALLKLLELANANDAPRIVFGQSLGGAVAVSLLARVPQACAVDGLIVEGAFSGYRAIAREKLASSWLTWPLQIPLSWTISDDFRPLEDIARLQGMHKLIIGTTGDRTVPVHHARALFAAAPEPKTFWEIPDLPHNAAFALPQYRRALLEWLEDVSSDKEILGEYTECGPAEQPQPGVGLRR